MYTERRKADREAMAANLMALAQEYGWEAERESLAAHEVSLHLSGPRGLAVWLLFDGKAHPLSRDCHCMAWTVHHSSDARLSIAFGTAMGSAVNPYHRQKCTAFASGFDTLRAAVEKAMQMANSGEAFDKEFEAAP